MTTRLPPTAVALLVVLTACWLYMLLVVPLIEPSVEPASPPPLSSKSRGGNPMESYYRLLARHFPPGHWALNNPKVLESPAAMLLLKDWRSYDDGRVELVPCAIVLFPGKLESDSVPMTAPVILEADAGALLKFDEGFDLARAKVGKLAHGQLRGPITIRSDMDQAGPADDLRITTRDVQLNESRVWTDADVAFQLGEHHGQGSQMEIRLLPASAAKSGGPQGIRVGGVHWLEFKKNVRVHLVLDNVDLVPGASPSAAASRAAKANAAARFTSASDAQPPLRVTCAGRFYFNPERRIATFEDEVDVLRLRPNAASDTLSCRLLTLEFAEADPRPDRSGGALPPFADRVPAAFALHRIVAEGDPVKIASPATGTLVHCQRLECQPNDLPGRLPLVTAAGPGQLDAAVGENLAQRLQITWQENLVLRRHGGEPVVSLWGQASLTMADVGVLSADTMHLYLQETADQDARAGQPSVSPDRMVAVTEAAGNRNVRIKSQPLTGAVEQLQIWFVRQRPPQEAAATAADGAAPSGGDAFRWNGGQLSKATYDINGRLLKVELAMTGRDLKVANLTVDDDVCLHETRTARHGDGPLTLLGNHLRVDGADTAAAQVTVQGAPASIEARTLALQGATVHLSRGDNRLWVDTPGQMSLPIRRDLVGHPFASEQRPAESIPTEQDQPPADAHAGHAAPPGILTVSWQDRMDFDGRKIQFEKSVVARNDDGWIRTDSLTVTLSQEIRFDQAADAAGVVGVQEIVCRGDVGLQHRSLDGQELASLNHMASRDLSIDQVTGRIHATGPGWVSSVRMGDGNLRRRRPLSGTPGESARTDLRHLEYLRVDYDQEANGSLHQRTLTFSGGVRAVHGPVDAWDAQIPVDNPDGVGPDDVRLTSDTLSITQTPLTLTGQAGQDRDTLELDARGNALVEGETFFARAARMSYIQAKDLMILEGSGTTAARLWRQTDARAPGSEVAAGKILYWRSDERVRVDDPTSLNLSQMRHPVSNPEAASTRVQPTPR